MRFSLLITLDNSKSTIMVYFLTFLVCVGTWMIVSNLQHDMAFLDLKSKAQDLLQDQLFLGYPRGQFFVHFFSVYMHYSDMLESLQFMKYQIALPITIKVVLLILLWQSPKWSDNLNLCVYAVYGLNQTHETVKLV